jgi:small nuclear ribonucleoprotein (snRNP)-like protein
MFKRTISALAIAAVAYVGVTQAQENATLTLKSGERISGHLVDLNNSGFTVKVNNEERQIPKNDVAVIDFAGGTMSDADWARVKSGEQIVWLRNGQTVTGQLFDIGGTSPLRLTFKTDSGDRELTSAEVGRIVLARTDATATAAGNASATTGTSGTAGIVVTSKQQWTPTGITVRQGDTLTFSSTGEVRLSGNEDDVAVPAGARSGRVAPDSPIPATLAGSLIGRIGTGQPFGIGNQTTIMAPASGRLFLGINDGHLADNSGEFRVEITRSGGAIRR